MRLRNCKRLCVYANCQIKRFSIQHRETQVIDKKHCSYLTWNVALFLALLCTENIMLVNKHRKYPQKCSALSIIVNYSIIIILLGIMCLDSFINFYPWWWVTPLQLISKAVRFELVPRMCTNYPAPHCHQVRISD